MSEPRPLDGLSEFAKAAFGSILRRGEATRRLIAADVGASFPTVTNVIGELESMQLVHEVRREQGARGRATLVYGVSPLAGWMLAIDIGSTQVSLIARRLDGSTLATRSDGVQRGDGFEPARHAAKVAAELLTSLADAGPPLTAAIAINQVVPKVFEDRPPTSEPRLSQDIVAVFMATAGLPDHVPVLVENNVNCAAVAEHEDGMMRGLDDCAYVQIGVGIGLGFFADGVLIRGGGGASGELAQIPLSWSAGIPSPKDELERVYGSVGLLAAATERWPADEPAPESTEAVFAAGENGHPVANAVMREHAVALARIASAAATVIDPSVLVLGGGLSKNATFVAMIDEEFTARARRTELRASWKGTAATVEGAMILARDLALSRMLGLHHRPLLGRPAIWGDFAEGEPVLDEVAG